MAKLFRDFYDRDTCTVARELVGKYLVRRLDGQLLVCRITETEAYIGRCDKACHAYQYRRTQRTETLFAAPGTVYLYLIYGMYHCLNLVTGADTPAGIRSLSPVCALARARSNCPPTRERTSSTAPASCAKVCP